VILPPARSRARGSGPLPDCAGYSAVELVAVLAIVSAVTAVVAPGVFQLSAALAVRSSAGEVRAMLFQARALAISRGRYVGVKFRKNGNRYEWALYGDGNGNGIRTAEITRGVDPPLGIAIPWTRNDVRPGILLGGRVPDPGDPHKALDRPDDPIRFNASDICSFSPLGESTPGSIYLWDGRDRMAVVRVFGRTAKIRTLYFRRGEKEWKL
jgi:type II secretory pathway pseudopilin PulG